jgi:hypothetical protein
MGSRPLGFYHGRIHVCLRAVRQGVEEWDIPILLDWCRHSAYLAGVVPWDGDLVGSASSVVLGPGGFLGSS